MAGTAKHICKAALLLWAISGGPAAAQIGLQSLASPGTEGPRSSDAAAGTYPKSWFAEHQWRQWSATNYARAPYQRYVNTSIEGDYFYDAFGNFLNQGWLIYNVSQSNPEEFGTVLFEAQHFRNWFSEVAVASEQKGQYAVRADHQQRPAHHPDAHGAVQTAPRRRAVRLCHGQVPGHAPLRPSQCPAWRHQSRAAPHQFHHPDRGAL